MYEIKIVHSTQVEKIEKEINELLAQGWQLSGPLSVESMNNKLYYTQSLYRFDINKVKFAKELQWPNLERNQ
jgi:hypothetical protein